MNHLNRQIITGLVCCFHDVTIPQSTVSISQQFTFTVHTNSNCRPDIQCLAHSWLLLASHPIMLRPCGNIRTIQDNHGDGQVKIKLGSCNVVNIFGNDANIRIQGSWGMMPHCWVCGSCFLKETWCLHLQESQTWS